MTICGMTLMGVMAFAQTTTTNPATGTLPNGTNGTLNNGTNNNINSGSNSNINGTVTPAQPVQGVPQTQTNPATGTSQQSAYPSQTQPITDPQVQPSTQSQTESLTQPSLQPSQPMPAAQPQAQPLTPAGAGQPQVTTPGTQLQGNQSLQPATNTPLNNSTNLTTPPTGTQPRTGSQQPPK